MLDKTVDVSVDVIAQHGGSIGVFACFGEVLKVFMFWLGRAYTLN